ncbi:MAG: RdgB/HAM1 family non-canonical purine NTP pyrophosphatase [Corallococcus sp.]|nr:RdgB/HAM1 family non-canonical purine NTP pyrophosphatase [Corallococcus sp.]
MKLLVASNNKHKIKEIKSILKNYFDEIQGLEEANVICNPDEDGETFYDNALIKAREAAKYAANCAVLADDTGLCVDALNGMPGIYSARYASEHDSAANRKKLLRELTDVTDRSAHFETVTVLLLPTGDILCSAGRADGYILEKEDGTNGFGYDGIFFSTELNKSFGQASDIEKNAVSHRARALNNLIELLRKSNFVS